MKKIYPILLGAAAVLLLCEPSWADIAQQATAQRVTKPASPWWGFVGMIPSVGFVGYLTWCLYNIYRPLGHVGLAITLGFVAWPIADIGNFTGRNPREVSIFTYQNPYYISKHEHDRVYRLTWKFQEECRAKGDDRCVSSVWAAYHECKGTNNCRGKLVEVYNERRRELAADPHAFSSFKPCEDWRMDRWAKCW